MVRYFIHNLELGSIVLRAGLGETRIILTALKQPTKRRIFLKHSGSCQVTRFRRVWST